MFRINLTTLQNNMVNLGKFSGKPLSRKPTQRNANHEALIIKNHSKVAYQIWETHALLTRQYR